MGSALENAPKISGSSIITGAILLIAGVLIVTEKVDAPMALGIVISVMGLFGLLFGFTVSSARRMIAALQAKDEEAR
ncbi:hypothetical protein [Euryhalocaulis caribicus]|uniref:hypothetical protein n=1 Tax=Euryhalocaulis caribicus TaxID=1161401 RepID=UPI00039CAEBB|nr:hypothetical protein [Euryhalocaulis caribicus]